ncbi:MAG: hypothetical protein EOO16_10320 [Chitinophagaceae bacterium]|nr:MAG: hypothetical protein EOO16_10320 [Chitinophagaceae bacterium]
MKAELRFNSGEELRAFLREIGVPEQTAGKMNERSTFGEFTEAQLRLAREKFGSDSDVRDDQGGRIAP